MRKLITGKLTSGLLCVFMVLSVFFSTGVFAASTEADTNADETNTAAVEEIGVKYCGHVQNKGDMPYVNSPTPLGTRGESLRIEGFCFDLTGPVPAGAKLVYQVHVQNRGWMAPVSSADFAGTRGESLRVESIRISLENLPGYDVYYRGHVQNVGDIPQTSGEWGWVKNGADLGTTGSSLRLEEITVKIVKQPTTTTSYDKAGTFGPATGSEEIAGDAIINVPDVTLQNLHIKGNLTIGEGVGSGNVTLNNVTVDGDTFVNGGGKNSIHINGGSYNKITVEKTATGEVRIVATGIDGLEVVISEDATGEDIILEGDFADVTVNAPDVTLKTQGDTTIGNMTVGEKATSCEVTLAEGTKVEKMVLDSGADVKGKGTIDKAEVNADNVKFETKPTEQVIDPGVVVPPVVVPPVVPPTPGGGGTDPSVAALAAVNAATSASAMQTVLIDNASALGLVVTDYNALIGLYGPDRKLAVAADMLANKPYASVTAVSQMFSDLASARLSIQTALNQLNVKNPPVYISDPDVQAGKLTVLDTIVPKLTSLGTAKFSGVSASTIVSQFNLYLGQYQALPLSSRQLVLDGLVLHADFTSFSELLLEIQTLYGSVPKV